MRLTSRACSRPLLRAIASTWRTLRPRLTICVGQLFGVRLADQHARMPGGELAGIDVGLHALGELQQPQRVGDMAAALADDLGDVVLV